MPSISRINENRPVGRQDQQQCKGDHRDVCPTQADPSGYRRLAHQVDPLSRRGFFMTASAAAAAGYTLAAGPVRAEAIKTDTDGLNAGTPKSRSPTARCRSIRAPANAQNPPVILVAMEIFGLHEYIKDVTRRLAKLGAFAVAPDYYFRKGDDLTKITDIQQLMPLVNASRTPNCSPISTRPWPGRSPRAAIPSARHHGLLPRRPHGVGIFRAQPEPEGRRRVLRLTGRSAAQKQLWPKSPTELAPEMKAPVLGLYGGADQGIPVAQVEAMKAALRPQERPPSSRSIPARHTASTPTTGRAIARKRRTMPGHR